MKIDVKGNPLEGKTPTEIHLWDGEAAIKHAVQGYVWLDVPSDEVYMDLHQVGELIEGLQLALKMGWLEPAVKGVE